MEKEKSKILVRDVQTKQVLFECPFTESEKAWQFAAEMEEMGLDIEVIAPTLGETLSTSLGLSREEQQGFMESLEEEIEGHAGCCVADSKDEKFH